MKSTFLPPLVTLQHNMTLNSNDRPLTATCDEAKNHIQTPIITNLNLLELQTMTTTTQPQQYLPQLHAANKGKQERKDKTERTNNRGDVTRRARQGKT